MALGIQSFANLPAEERQNLRLVYQEVCQSYLGIASFRAWLLGLLPLASGAGFFVLLGDLGGNGGETLEMFLGPLGFFGFFITLGLFTNEIRGIQWCIRLIDTGKYLECLMGIPGQFFTRPANVAGFIGTTFAAGIIYPAVLVAWLFLAMKMVPNLNPTGCLLISAGVAVLLFIAFRFLDKGKHRRQSEICPQWGAPAGTSLFN